MIDKAVISERSIIVITWCQWFLPIETWDWDLDDNLIIYVIIWADTRQNNRMTCAPNEDSDQPVFAVRSRVAKDLSFFHADSEDWSDWMDAKADLSHRWVHRSFWWFCREAAHLLPL